jgi:DNA-directed RNA polymerase I, II, and III subunit RPABC1
MAEEYNSYNFFRVYKTVCKMLYNRGYQLPKEYTYEEFKKIPRKDLTITTEARRDAKIYQEPIMVFFPEDEKIGVKVGVKPIRLCKTEMREKVINRGIIVSRNDITTFARAEIKNESNTKEPLFIEIFSEPELIIDITEHILVPKHELLTDDEKDELLKIYPESQLPKILLTDPVARYYGLKKKDIVKITRVSETAGYYINYRVVT